MLNCIAWPAKNPKVVSPLDGLAHHRPAWRLRGANFMLIFVTTGVNKC